MFIEVECDEKIDEKTIFQAIQIKAIFVPNNSKEFQLFSIKV